jgi:hypothetical protein
MTPEIKNRIRELNEAYIEQLDESDGSFVLSENGAGQIRCQIKVLAPAILLKNLDKWKLNCFKQKKCADYAMIKRTADGYSLHLFELKTTVGRTEWLEILQQFIGAFLRAKMVASFLCIPLCDVHVYTVYRKKKTNTQPIVPRSAISNGKEREQINAWEEDSVNLRCFGTYINCRNHRILLGQNDDENTVEIIW